LHSRPQVSALQAYVARTFNIPAFRTLIVYTSALCLSPANWLPFIRSAFIVEHYNSPCLPLAYYVTMLLCYYVTMLPLLPFPSSAVLHLSRNLSISRVSTYPHQAPYGPSNVPLIEPMWWNDLQPDAASKNSFLTGRIFESLISRSTPIVEKLMVTHLDKERYNFFATRMLIAVFTKLRHLTPAMMRLCLPAPSEIIASRLYFNTGLPSTTRP